MATRLFAAETVLTRPSSFAEPRIHVEMCMGGRARTSDGKTTMIEPSLNRDDSLATWDDIVRSIRLRPGSV